MNKFIILGVLLVGCTQSDLLKYDLLEPEFEWVEPLIFQHNLQICRSNDVCRAEDLFN